MCQSFDQSIVFSKSATLAEVCTLLDGILVVLSFHSEEFQFFHIPITVQFENSKLCKDCDHNVSIKKLSPIIFYI